LCSRCCALADISADILSVGELAGTQAIGGIDEIHPVHPQSFPGFRSLVWLAHLLSRLLNILFLAHLSCNISVQPEIRQAFVRLDRRGHEVVF
jgi:hypothetical protein